MACERKKGRKQNLGTDFSPRGRLETLKAKERESKIGQGEPQILMQILITSQQTHGTKNEH